jgi:CBS domain-containing protein
MGGQMLVGEIMTRNVFTVTADTTVAEVAQLFMDKKISGAPVIDAVALRQSSDDDLCQQLCDRMKSEPWAKVQFVNTHVHDGVVELNGYVGAETQKKALRMLAENLPGMQAVRDRISLCMCH